MYYVVMEHVDIELTDGRHITPGDIFSPRELEEIVADCESIDVTLYARIDDAYNAQAYLRK